MEKKIQSSLTCPISFNYYKNDNENETRGNLLSVYYVKINKFWFEVFFLIFKKRGKIYPNAVRIVKKTTSVFYG